MKIYYLTYGGDGFMYDWQDINFIDELKRHGCTINKISVSQKIQKVELSEMIKKHFIYNSYDIFMTSCDDRVFSIDFFKELKNISIPTVLFCCDNLSVPFIHKKYCKQFDLVWLTSNETKDIFEKWGAQVMFLPYGSNPYTYSPIQGNEINGISFVGSLYGARPSKISELLKNGTPVNLYGGNGIVNTSSNPINNSISNFRHSLYMTINLMKFDIGRKCLKAALNKSILKEDINLNLSINNLNRQKLSFGELSNIYSRSMLSLGVTELWNTYLLKHPIHKIHLRSFEIPMSGGLQIVSRSDEFVNYFKENEEIIFYESKEELISKSNFYLKANKSSLRESMKLKARKRSIQEHTWTIRFSKLFDKLNLKKIG